MPTIISMHSFRGGTGKTNLIANLAGSMVQQGRRVAIVDTDLPSPGMHVVFGLDEGNMGHTLNDYLYGHCSIEEVAHDVTSTLGEPQASGGALYLLPSSIQTSDIIRLLREGYEINLLQDSFYEVSEALTLDYLLLDTHPGLNEETLLSIGISDLLVVLLRPDKQDFQGTAITLEVARKLAVEQSLLVLNKVLPSLDGQSLKQRIQQTYQVPVAGVLPLSEQMVQMGSEGLFLLNYPEHSYSQGVREIAAQLVSAAGGTSERKAREES